MKALANKFLEVVGDGVKPKLIKYPPNYPSDEPSRRCPNIDKTVETTNIQPKTDLASGIKKMHDYYKNLKT